VDVCVVEAEVPGRVGEGVEEVQHRYGRGRHGRTRRKQALRLSGLLFVDVGEVEVDCSPVRYGGVGSFLAFLAFLASCVPVARAVAVVATRPAVSLALRHCGCLDITPPSPGVLALQLLRLTTNRSQTRQK
jgi:hypothetical protein